jgi:hypothetical protein
MGFLEKFLENPTPSQILLIILFLGIGYTVIRDIIIAIIAFRQKTALSSPLAISRILQTTLSDTPSVLAFGIGATVAILALSERPIPGVLSNAFFMIVGYYFGRRSFIRNNDENRDVRSPGTAE